MSHQVHIDGSLPLSVKTKVAEARSDIRLRGCALPGGVQHLNEDSAAPLSCSNLAREGDARTGEARAEFSAPPIGEGI